MGKKKKITIPKGTLLYEYWEQQIDAFVPPQREGREKGSTIGFPKVKFGLALLFLFDLDLSLKDKAEMFHVNYSLLRRWVREPEFRRVVGLAHAEFVVVFMDYIRKWDEQYMKLYAQAVKQPLNKITAQGGGSDKERLEHIALLKRKIADAQYHPVLTKSIADAISKEIDNANVLYLSTLDIVGSLLCGSEYRNEIKEKSTKILRLAACRILDLAKEAIAKAPTPLEERKTLLFGIGGIQDSIREGRL